MARAGLALTLLAAAFLAACAATDPERAASVESPVLGR
jgi:outer membrane biogenesis lipoprotein LolB